MAEATTLGVAVALALAWREPLADAATDALAVRRSWLLALRLGVMGVRAASFGPGVLARLGTYIVSD